MILSNLQNANRYKGLSSALDKAIDYLTGTDFASMENGRYPVDGDDVFALVQRYNTLDASEVKCEAHKNYLDVQCVISGDERIGYADISTLTPSTEYNPEKDMQFFTGEQAFIPLHTGDFMILFPEDCHSPKACFTEPSPVVKVVLKVRCN